MAMNLHLSIIPPHIGFRIFSPIRGAKRDPIMDGEWKLIPKGRQVMKGGPTK